MTTLAETENDNATRDGNVITSTESWPSLEDNIDCNLFTDVQREMDRALIPTKVYLSGT